jgi:hypothetical protein
MLALAMGDDGYTGAVTIGIDPTASRAPMR